MFLITGVPIDAARVLAQIESPKNGAVATFMGIARNHSEGKAVRGLYYEAYEPMALKTFEKIGIECKILWQITRLAIVHRVGKLEIGEMAVLVAASAPHRRAALDACSYAIDRVKEISPIWKKEFFDDRAQAAWGANKKDYACI